MKILAISALHPPYHSGGYELRVKNILDGLAERGHTIRVLTNQPERQAGKRAETSPYPVLRSLHNRYKARFFPREILLDLQDTALLEKQIAEFQPDVVYIGHLYILSKALLPFLARRRLPILYDEGGSGLIDAWTDHGRWFRFTGEWRSRFAPLNWIKPAVIRLVCLLGKGLISPRWQWPQQMRVVFNSRLNQTNALVKGVPVENSTVIHSGVDTDTFKFRERKNLNEPLTIIVPGRIERRKGQLDAIKLLKELLDAGIDTRLKLVGAGCSDSYAEEILKYTKEHGLQDKLELKPMLSHKELVEEYHSADICFFPSYQTIGFSRVPLEAMACGCIVITYGNEGSDEVIVQGKNGFLLEQGNIPQVAEWIRKLLTSPALAQEVLSNARNDIVARYSLKQYILAIEEQTHRVITDHASY